MTAHAGHKQLIIAGGGSKRFYGNTRQPGSAHYVLDMTAYRGIVNYQPSELVVTARAGTPLAELEAVLAEQGQMLAFEPPHFDSGATVGGCVAAGLAGPRRQACGGVRDYVLGVRLLDSQGHLLSFGGEVMKNVAGYDVSRLMSGSLGMFGALIDVSLKVVPKPVCELTVHGQSTQQDALALFARWRRLPLPVSATAWVPDGGGSDGGGWLARLSGSAPALRAARAQVGGKELEPAVACSAWQALREQTHAFFQGGVPLWRLAVSPTAPPLRLGPMLLEWGGGQRWLSARADAQAVRAAAQEAGGHATLFRAHGGPVPADGVFHPLSPGVAQITRRLKQELDPAGLFNPGRMVLEL
ncbi:FAD binding domain protein [Bordetella holmesii 70147]|uniref:FAD binding domain protein n=2 Tax=Bordetella holmesii TaxID=35814 RepID=A0ABN0RVS4_9BORD|nr:FAD binding domain protein [Bordetella holmesii ATCC 51541]AIT27269.1 FAD binding domain protein [Bordetella holmesii 44057]EWM47852.1 FAD binding domain protein [Bordetella holmesii 35009]EWM52017.1 FAD binding domain protein [Bordetella holmesii 70147]EXX93312.1 FAD binding domain protein [Bordetella holmesii 1058]